MVLKRLGGWFVFGPGWSGVLGRSWGGAGQHRGALLGGLLISCVVNYLIVAFGTPHAGDQDLIVRNLCHCLIKSSYHTYNASISELGHPLPVFIVNSCKKQFVKPFHSVALNMPSFTA
jgi:hypothetical protein